MHQGGHTINPSQKGNRLNLRTSSACQRSKYLQLRLNQESKVAASIQCAQIIWKKGPYMATCIRSWAKGYIVTGTLPVHKQDEHVKAPSLLQDEDFSINCRNFEILQARKRSTLR